MDSNYTNNNHDMRKMLRDYVQWEFNAFLWISLFVMIYLLLNRVFHLLRLWSYARRIPGPPCSFFHGHSRLLSRQSLTEVLAESHHKYGSIVKLWFGPARLLVSVKDPVLIKEMLLKAEDKLPLTGKAIRLAFGQSSLFASSFSRVQKKRESLATELNGRIFERGNLNYTNIVDSVMERILENKRKEGIDCTMASQQLAFTMLGATFFGDTFLALPEATMYEELLMAIAKDAGFWASYRVTPFWKRGFWRYQNLCTKLKCLTQDIVQQCQRNCKLFYNTNRRSHTETVNAGLGAALGGPYFSIVLKPENVISQEVSDNINAKEEEPWGNIMSMMFHGCSSTAGLISNILTRLAAHPEIQDKIYLEITMARNKSERGSIEKMLLLLATVYESARLLPAGTLLQRCLLKDDLTLKTGVTIPAGASLVVPVHLVQMDNCSWGSDADQFNPYRFLLETGKQSHKAQHNPSAGATNGNVAPGQVSFVLNNPSDNAAFLPFGSGIRACVGQKFIIQAVATLFASLLEVYEIQLQSKSGINPKPKTNSFVLQLDPSPKIVFVKRNT